MSNMSSYRLSIVAFSLGLLWVVSEVVGDDERPGALDQATKSVVHRLNASGESNGENSEPIELAVSRTYMDESRQNPSSTQAEEPAGDTATSSSVDGDADELAQVPAPPDASLIHK